MILGVTGHRLHLLPGYRGDGSSSRLRQIVLEVAVDMLEEWNPDLVITGMATGWDLAVACGCMIRNTPFHAYVPFEGQARNWSRTDREAYHGLMEEAADVRVICSTESRRAYYLRDIATVDASDPMAALWNGDGSTGTGMTLEYAHGWLVPWTNYWGRLIDKVREKGLATRG